MLPYLRLIFSKDKELYIIIKNILGVYPGNIFLYKLALRHRSASLKYNGIKRNNERLEYLGDAVLSAIVAEYLFKKYPTEGEGFLTELRSKIVSRASLNKVGLHMQLGKLVQMESALNGVNSLNAFKSVNGDALEALIGAVFLDKGFKVAKKIVVERILGIYMDIDAINHTQWNFKSKLLDWGQQNRCKIDYRIVEHLMDHNRRMYKIHACINGETKGEGLEYSIKAAEQLAAEQAYKNYVEPMMERAKNKHCDIGERMYEKYNTCADSDVDEGYYVRASREAEEEVAACGLEAEVS